MADVYETPMPQSVSQVLAFAEVLSVNIAALGFRYSASALALTNSSSQPQ